VGQVGPGKACGQRRAVLGEVQGVTTATAAIAAAGAAAGEREEDEGE
jgi:hypothetical protein